MCATLKNNRSMIDIIINRLTGQVVIKVSPNEFTFLWRGKSLNIKTYVYLFDDNGYYRILGIGEDFEGSSRSTRVELFSEKLPPNDRILRPKLLELFIRFGLQKIIGRRSIMRPTVVFEETHNIAKILSGYQNSALIEAAYKAGAYSVQIN